MSSVDGHTKPTRTRKRHFRDRVIPIVAGAAFILAPVACVDDGGGLGASVTSSISTTTTTAPLPEVDGLPPSTETLAGVWLNDGGPTPGQPRLMLQLDRDGTMIFDNGGRLDDVPAVRGRYQVEGSRIAFTAGSNSSACDGGDTWAWRAGVSEDGRLHIVNIEDGTRNCRIGIGTEWTWTRVSPRSSRGAEIATANLAGKGSPSESSLRGIWLLEGTGRLLRFGANGTYADDDSGTLATKPDDVGGFVVSAAAITFTSTAPADCEGPGAYLMDQVVLVGRTLRGTLTSDSCTGAAAGAQTWIQLSP